MPLTDAQRAAIEADEFVTLVYPVPDERRAPMPEPLVRLAILDAQRVAPRGAGLPRGIALAGVAAAVLMAAGLALCGLAAYGAIALWRALP